jgi:hypothetical protein
MRAPLSPQALRLLADLNAAGALPRSEIREGEPAVAELLKRGWVVVTDDLLWPARGLKAGGHARHVAWVGHLYLALSPWLAAWTRDRPPAGPVPDARFRLVGSPVIWLEADTGKENAAQWRHKLLRYHLHPPVPLWVAALGGTRRRARLAALVATLAAGPHLVTGGPDAVDELRAWAGGLTVAPDPQAAAPDRFCRFYEGERLLTQEEVRERLAAGWRVGGREIRRGEIRCRLVRS